MMRAPAIDSVRSRLIEAVQPQYGRIPMPSDPDVHQLETSTVFREAWPFVAHVSELPEAGSFVVRDMGESVIAARSDDRTVRVFLNSCRHRGMRLACEDFGSTNVWRCSRHGFTYGSNGEFLGTLVGAPYERVAYRGGLDRDALHFIEAKVDTYQGLIFATWSKQPPQLVSYLGNAAWYLDLVVGRAEMEVAGAPQTSVVPNGWKLLFENCTADAYHTATAHSFSARLGLVQKVDLGRDSYHVGREHE
jgi:phenylpropionate dioxygenase-like ring-hydroxylating dioxygenase large terminal subunit